MTTRWWEITVKTSPDLEDSVFWRLQEFGSQGTATQRQENYIAVTGYVPAMTAQLLDVAALSLWLEQDAVLAAHTLPSVSWHLIEEEDWANAWKQSWQPIEVGDRLLICPAWLEPPAHTDRIVLRLDPGCAFGTGVHPTTQLCLESLEMRLEGAREEVKIADIGCGSGILSIASVLLGAHDVVAVDTDLLAVKATQENSYLNGISSINVMHGSIDRLAATPAIKFDGIVCNILADVIKAMIPQMNQIIKPNGWGILSGILLEQSIEIVDLLEANNWVVAALWKRDEWCCINIRRS